MKKPLVGNAADQEQVQVAEEKVQNRRERELNDLRSVLALPSGRRFLWRLMGHCKTFGSIWEQSARIHYNSGQQDIGHYVMAEITEAGEEFLFQMMKENKENLNV
jgi:hypothetical protein